MHKRNFRWCYVVLAYACAALALIGVLVPGLPTTPFLLVAAWAAAKGSPRLYRWLHDNRHFGPLLRNWRDQGAVSIQAKISAVTLLAISWIGLAWYTTDKWILVATTVLFLVVAIFLASRPLPRNDLPAADSETGGVSQRKPAETESHAIPCRK